MISNTTAAFGIIFSLFGGAMAHGSLSLVINPTDKTFALTGQDSGIPFNTNSGGLIRWNVPNLGFEGPATNSIILNDDKTFSTSVGTPGGPFPYDTVLNTDELAGGSIAFMLATSSGAFQTLTGLGNFESYATFTPANQAKFESLVGGSFTLTSGSGFGPLGVVAVPEPSSMLLALAAGTALIWRRKV